MKPIIIIPTYNERENIQEIISEIYAQSYVTTPDILVVDSASPDNTVEVVEEIQKKNNLVKLIRQPKKLGLGKAYLEGMEWATRQNYDCIVTMDADFSHHPRYLPQMLAAIKDHDLVIGSRYVKGGRLQNWPYRRKLLSAFANWYARTLTGLPFHDLTAGFHCFRTELLKKILSHSIETEGYAFLVELKYLAKRENATFREIPIIFSDRTKGSSKISNRVIWESIQFVLRLARSRIGAGRLANEKIR